MIPSSNLHAFLLFIGRTGLASLFFLGGINKIANYTQTLQSMEGVGVAPAALLLPVVIALELGGAVLIMVGRQGAPMAGVVLAIYTLATNFFFHNFWTMEGEHAALELSLFFKNVSIAGGMLFVASAINQARASQA